MYKQGVFISFLLFLFLLPACRKPSWVLSEKQMEDLLFDIHLADAEISNSFIDFRTEKQKQDLYASVFEKHKITQEQFDTSLVWYGKNLSKFLEIYDKLNERYSIVANDIAAKIDREKKQVTPPLDSVEFNLWKGQEYEFVFSFRKE